jgi:hypothetical protein
LNPKIDKSYSNTSRKEIFEFETSNYLQSYTQMSTNSIHGVSNYYLLVYSDEIVETPSLVMFFLDSGGGSIPEMIYHDQTEWLFNTSKSISFLYGEGIPAIVYVHIPTPEFATPGYNDKDCWGDLAEDKVATTEGINSLISTLFSLKSSTPVYAIFIGHNHGNDWCCSYQSTNFFSQPSLTIDTLSTTNLSPSVSVSSLLPVSSKNNITAMTSTIDLCFGRHSGYGGYGNWDKGARVLKVNLNPFSMKTWIRLENGSVVSMHNIT